MEFWRPLSLFRMITQHISRYVKPLNGAIKTLPTHAAEAALSAYFRYCNLSPCTVDLHGGETSMHIWAAKHRRRDRPNLVLVHGFGGNSKWQFIFQVAHLTRNFNVYVPDLVFFGKSYSRRAARTDTFQARCVCEGMERLGVEKYSVYGISYGGFVGYRMAVAEEERVERVVIVSSGIVCTAERRAEHLKKIGRNILELLVPEEPEDIRTLCRMSMYKYDIAGFFPDFFLRGFIALEVCNKEKQELVEELLSVKPDLPVLTQETLLIWGDKDLVFPLNWAYHLHRHLGGKSKLEIIRNVGHAANIEAPRSLNHLITSFLSPLHS